MNRSRKSRQIYVIHRLEASGGLALTAMLVIAAIGTSPALAQTYSVLYRFTGGSDGAYPHAGLIRDSMGNLYGTTVYGGSSGFGTVFKVETGGQEKVLHSLSGSDGVNPYASLVRDARGNFYGTSYGGGIIGAPACIPGCGAVFKLDATGKEIGVYDFPGEVAGNNPYANVIGDSIGNLYGTTYGGGTGMCAGALGCGVVFKLDATGKETLLHSFGVEPQDGVNPQAAIVRDWAGNFYGTTVNGGGSGCVGLGCGVVFKLSPTGNETVLHRFGKTPGDGLNPYASVILVLRFIKT